MYHVEKGVEPPGLVWGFKESKLPQNTVGPRAALHTSRCQEHTGTVRGEHCGVAESSVRWDSPTAAGRSTRIRVSYKPPITLLTATQTAFHVRPSQQQEVVSELHSCIFGCLLRLNFQFHPVKSE